MAGFTLRTNPQPQPSFPFERFRLTYDNFELNRHFQYSVTFCFVLIRNVFVMRNLFPVDNDDDDDEDGDGWSGWAGFREAEKLL